MYFIINNNTITIIIIIIIIISSSSIDNDDDPGDGDYWVLPNWMSNVSKSFYEIFNSLSFFNNVNKIVVFLLKHTYLRPWFRII